MPTYEYECTECGVVFDLFQPITEPARKKLKKGDPRACDCEAPVQRRISGGGGIIFKGSGFYQTDYRSESYKKAAKADSESSSKSGSDGKNDSKKSADTKKADSSKSAADSKKSAGSAGSSADTGGGSSKKSNPKR